MRAVLLRLPVPSIPVSVRIGVFCALWASAFSVSKIALADCPPLLLLTMRFLLAGALMLGAAAISGMRLRLTGGKVLFFVILGLVNQAAYLGLSNIGLQSVSSGSAALIISANPVLTSLLAVPFLGERMSGRKAGGLVLGVFGVLFVVAHRFGGGVDHPIGIAFTVAALISMVCGTIVFKKFAPEGELWAGTAVQSLAAGSALLPIALNFEQVADIRPSWRLMVTLGYLVLFVSVLAYVLWFHLLTVFGATAASSYHFLMPPLGLLFGWTLLGEPVAISDLLGIVPVAVGIYLITHSARHHEKSGGWGIAAYSRQSPTVAKTPL
jgi:drug/metabolite transporter (DMT)-like permease